MKKLIIGIYKITSPSGKVYIGQSWNIHKRWIYYKYVTAASRQFSLTNSFLKYGYKSHSFEVLHELPPDVTQDVMNTYEQFYMDQYRAVGIKLMNCREGGYNGRLHPDTIERSRQKNIGQKRTQETRDKISLANTGQIFSDERKRNISNSKKGMVISPEHRQKISESSRGHKKPMSHGKNVSKALRGVPKSEEHKKALSESRIVSGVASGVKNPNAKLTEAQVREIRQKRAAGASHKELCAEYNVKKLWEVFSGKHWKNV